MPLRGKKIVICRRPEQAAELIRRLHREGVWPLVFPTTRFERLSISEDQQRRLLEFSSYHWLLFGSSNGVSFFADFIDRRGRFIEAGKAPRIGTVGSGAAARWQSLFPRLPVEIAASSLQELAEQISSHSRSKPVKVLNPTSRQSLDNIVLEPAPQMRLDRVPIYHSVAETGHTAAELEFVRSGKYDMLFFAAPSSFDFFRKLAGDEALDGGTVVAAIGPTTAAHIRQKGFRVDVVPSHPDAQNLVDGLRRFFSEKHPQNSGQKTKQRNQ